MNVFDLSLCLSTCAATTAQVDRPKMMLHIRHPAPPLGGSWAGTFALNLNVSGPKIPVREHRTPAHG
jgi:hypothetical protein